MDNYLFYTYKVHIPKAEQNTGLIPEKYLVSYYNSLIFDPYHRTIWHEGMPYGHTYVGGNSYAEVFNDYDTNVALGSYSHVEGSHNILYKSAQYSHIEGSNNETNFENSHIEGSNNSLVSDEQGICTHIEGYYNEVKSNYSHVEGSNNSLDKIAKYSHIEGCASNANAPYSHIEGANNVIAIESEFSHIEGADNQTCGTYTHIEGRHNTINPQNTCVHVGGFNNTINGMSHYSFIHGNNNKLYDDTHENVLVIGLENEIVSAASNAILLGQNLKASHNNEFAVGKYNESIDDAAFEFGIGIDDSNRKNALTISSSGNTYFNGGIYIKEGDKYVNISMSGIKASLENTVGKWTKGNVTYGEYFNDYQNNVASGDYSHAEGLNTKALGHASHTEGISTQTYNDGEHASGFYNLSTPGLTVFSVGNGTNIRHNLFELQNNGLGFINDNPITTSIDGTNTYIWKGTLSKYNQLVKKDPYKDNTLYFIDDGNGVTSSDIPSSGDLTSLQNQINFLTTEINNLKALLSNVIFKSSLANNTISYLWAGTLSNYNSISSSSSNYDKTTFIINP